MESDRDRVPQTVELRVDTSPEIVDRFAIRSVPTLIALCDGTEVGRLIGLQSGDAVRTLFDAASGTGGEVRRRTPTTLVAIRAAAGAVVILAGLLTGSIVLAAIGAALALWALLGLISR